ncbi:hypothetical protein [Vibrio lentus]|uniref:hypothetical protein n=1 Tax=Vibrio lentus TaxID=136468 RepID=UPI000C845E86|nr:hypothetical protein [Vibrio lentus]MCB5451493.1 hypothetical protein [Vibrio lentus]PMH03571.1 hypothetical protein BCU78_00350 [Vibrio lentus]
MHLILILLVFPVYLYVLFVKFIGRLFNRQLSDEVALLFGFILLISVIGGGIVIQEKLQAHPEVSLDFIQTDAKSLSKDEKVSICHAINGYLDLSFDYEIDGDRVIEKSGVTKESFCDFKYVKVKTAEIKEKNLNSCYQLTKAQIKRGGQPTYTEYNPQFSTYKDGMIYWRCDDGGRPKSTIVHTNQSQYSIYRYEIQPDILLVKANERFFYFFKSKILRSVQLNGKATDYVQKGLKISNSWQFNQTPNLIDKFSNLKDNS